MSDCNYITDIRYIIQIRVTFEDEIQKKKDIFDTQSTPEIFYYDFITLMSLLAASVSGSNVPNLGMNSANSDI